ncbi:MAG: peptidylprolyl isomerase [Deltaproteobacteria bacterium]|nr:peptidylprolyl isomerase [Deltaproteobacteria bacterium]
MRENSRSAIIYVLFGILIAAFVISFGPQSGQTGSCGTVKTGWAAKVSGTTISDADWRYGYIGLQLHRQKADRLRAGRGKEQLLDQLIEREILAREGRRMGFKVSREEAEDLIRTGRMVVLGEKVDARGIFFDQKGKGIFRYKRFKDYARQLTDTERAFLEQQQKELLALKAREVLEGAVVLSPSEVEAQFMAENDTVSFDFVRFAGARYLGDATVSEADAAAWLAAHEADAKAEYEKNKAFAYQGLPPEVRARHILVKVDPAAVSAVVDQAKAKADKLHERVTKGGEDFAKVAAEASEDKFTAKQGGDLRWRSDGQLGIGDEVDKVVKAAKDGEITAVVRGSDGFEILKIEKHRKGDQSFDDVKLDIAQQLALRDKGKTMAKDKAQAALDKLLAERVKQPTATLEVMFDREDMGGGMGDLPPGLPPELLKQLPPGVKIEMAPPGTTPGAPAPDPGSTPSAPSAPPAPAGSPAAPVGALSPWGALGNKVMMTQTTGTGAKPAAAGAKPAPAAGGSPIVVTAGGPAAATPPAAPPEPVVKPLPRDPELPKIEDSGVLTRSQAMQLDELGKSAKNVSTIFAAEEKTLLPTLIESDSSYVIVYVRSRSKPDKEDFAKRKDEIAHGYQSERVALTYRDWIKGACLALATAKKIEWSKSTMSYQDEDGKTMAANYEPCKSGFFDLVRR